MQKETTLYIPQWMHIYHNIDQHSTAANIFRNTNISLAYIQKQLHVLAELGFLVANKKGRSVEYTYTIKGRNLYHSVCEIIANIQEQ